MNTQPRRSRPVLRWRKGGFDASLIGIREGDTLRDITPQDAARFVARFLHAKDEVTTFEAGSEAVALEARPLEERYSR